MAQKMGSNPGLMRSGRNKQKGKYAAQRVRTTANKIRRIYPRLKRGESQPGWALTLDRKTAYRL